MMIAQPQMEASRRPSMTILTTGCAVRNSSTKEKPADVAGLICSSGFMASVLESDGTGHALGQAAKPAGREEGRQQPPARRRVRIGAPRIRPWVPVRGPAD